MAIHSGNKGKRYELAIAKEFAKWSNLELMRTPMSGAWQGTSGDIITKNLEIRSTRFPFVIECKNNEAWTFKQILTNSGIFYDWLDQLDDEVTTDLENIGEDDVSLFPMLVFTKNYFPDFIAFPYMLNIELPFPMVTTKEYYAITLLQDFFEVISYDDLLRIVTT